MKDDLISKTAAIKTAERMYKRCDTSSIADYHDLVVEALTELPSAQLAQDLPKGCTDTISRQAAINELKKISFSHWFECGEYLSEDTSEIEIINSNKALEVIEALPSAQPDIMRCKDCRYNNDCEIQYNAQSGDEFFCGCAERKDNG